MPNIPRQRLWRAPVTAGCLIGIYIGHRSISRAIAELNIKVDYLTRRAAEDYWSVYTEVQADMLGHEDRR
jgi:hypothetical protein